MYFFFFQAEDGIRDHCVTGVQTCALPISTPAVQRCSRPAGEPTLYFRPERLPLARAPGIHIGLTWRWLGRGRRSGLGRVRPRLRGLSGLDPVAPFPALRPTFRARATTAAAAAATTPAPPTAPLRPLA